MWSPKILLNITWFLVKESSVKKKSLKQRENISNITIIVIKWNNLEEKRKLFENKILKIMPYLSSWEEFARAAELLYLSEPSKCRFVMKYRHSDGKLVLKCTDNSVCLMYATQHSQDIKKVEKLSSQLMRHMTSKEK
jgi:signal recognition particle subunit SRP9